MSNPPKNQEINILATLFIQKSMVLLPERRHWFPDAHFPGPVKMEKQKNAPHSSRKQHSRKFIKTLLTQSIAALLLAGIQAGQPALAALSFDDGTTHTESGAVNENTIAPSYNGLVGNAYGGVVVMDSVSSVPTTVNFTNNVSVRIPDTESVTTFDVHGIGVYGASKVTFGPGTTVDIFNNASHDQYDNIGIATRGTAELVSDAQVNVEVSGTNSYNNSGITAYENSSMIFNDKLKIRVNESKGPMLQGIGLNTDPASQTLNVGSSITVKDLDLEVNGTGSGNLYVYGVRNMREGTFEVTGSAKIAVTGGASSYDVFGIENAIADSVLKLNDTEITVNGGTSRTYGIVSDKTAFTSTGYLTVTAKGTGTVTGVRAAGQNVHFDNLSLLTDNSASSYKDNYGVYASNIVVDGDLFIRASGGSSGPGNYNVWGLRSTDSTGEIVVNGNTDVTIIGGNQWSSGIWSDGHLALNGSQNNISYVSTAGTDRDGYVRGIYGHNGISLGSDSSTSVMMKVDGQLITQLQGVTSYGPIDIENGATLDVRVDAANMVGSFYFDDNQHDWIAGVHGVYTQGGVFEEGSKTNIVVSGQGVNNLGFGGTNGIGGYFTAKGDMTITALGQGVSAITARNNANNKQTYTGNLTVNAADGYALLTAGYTGGSNDYGIDVNPDSGKNVRLTGDVAHLGTGHGVISLQLKNGDSFLTGASLGASLDTSTTTDATTTIALSNGARWNVTGDSLVTHLNVGTDAVMDMRGAAESVQAGLFEGGGKIIMDADLTADRADTLTIKQMPGGTPGKTEIVVKSSGHGGDLVRMTDHLVVSEVDQDSANFYMNGKVDAGLYLYELDDEALASGRGWFLKRGDKKELGPSGELVTSMAGLAIPTSAWWSQLDNLRNRMGEVRGGASDGFWWQYYGQHDRADSFNGNGFTQNLFGWNLGLDREVIRGENNSLIVGANFKMTDGRQKTRNTQFAGRGDSESKGLNVYATWYNKGGSYADLVLSADRYDQNLKTNMLDGTPVNGDYHTWGYGISLEGGHKFGLSDDFFIEPQAQLSYFYLKAKDFALDNGMTVQQESARSLTGRLGVVFGKTWGISDNQWVQTHLKLGAKHEFKGDQTVYINDVHFRSSLGETRYYYGLGLDWKLNKQARIYTQIERESGDKYDKDIMLSAALKISF